MVTAPGATPVTTPELALMVAVAVFALLHMCVPPDVDSVNVKEPPWQTAPAPTPIAGTEGSAFTVTVLFLMVVHPLVPVTV